jgi:predicted transcriptional regulator
MRRHEIFTALADAKRREIVESLARNGTCTATELAAGMPITRQAVAKHLTHLHRADIVEPRRTGRELHYRLNPGRLGDAIDWLDEVCTRARATDAG